MLAKFRAIDVEIFNLANMGFVEACLIRGYNPDPNPAQTAPHNSVEIAVAEIGFCHTFQPQSLPQQAVGGKQKQLSVVLCLTLGFLVPLGALIYLLSASPTQTILLVYHQV